MKKCYKVTVVETVAKTYNVEASSKGAAIEEVFTGSLVPESTRYIGESESTAEELWVCPAGHRMSRKKR